VSSSLGRPAAADPMLQYRRLEYTAAVNAVAQLLTFYNAGADVDQVRNWLNTNVFALDAYASTDRPAGGQSDPRYLPDKK
jgi:hypothetical protein